MAKIEGQVLLIGLGGTGSRIVNNVVSDLQKAARRKNKKFSTADGKMAFAVLDTNMNDVGEINKSLTGINNISTSSEKKIKEYMSQYSYMGVSDWMPRSKTLDEETMIDGASQMRFKSRLALLDTIESHKIDELKNAIQTMIENRELGQKVRVMIVSSLAGGTGSGKSRTSLAYYDKGKEALALGGYNEDTLIELNSADTKVEVHNVINKDTFAPDDKIQIVNGRMSFIVNDKPVERKLRYDFNQ